MLVIISLVIPVYNEEKILENTIETVKAYMNKTFGQDYEVLFVNDGSRDNTLKIVESFADNNIKIISYKQNRGKGYAVRTGILAASSEIVFFTDCDLAYGLDVIGEGYAIMQNNKDADILLGSRRKHKDGFASYTLLRKIMSLTFYTVLKIYGGIKQTDSQTSMKGFRRSSVEPIFKLCEIDRWGFDFEILLIADKLGCKIIEMPVKIINHSESKVKIIKDGGRMLRELSQIKKRIKKIK